jgi:hypothetical protein
MRILDIRCHVLLDPGIVLDATNSVITVDSQP